MKIFRFALLLAVFLMFTESAGARAGRLTSPFESDVARAVEREQAHKDIAKENSNLRILGGITPHHGLALDMITRFYGQISSGAIRRVWLLSPDHFKRAGNYAAVCGDDWLAAGRTLAADAVAKSGFSNMSIVEVNSRLFADEHGITIHIPLIARYFPNATIVPMVLKSDTPDIVLLTLKNYMLGVMGEGDLVILSMDMSHYKTPEEMKAEDERSLEALTNLEPMKTDRIDIDARRAASLVLRLFKDMGAERGEVMERMDSSDIMGYKLDPKSGTSYATIIFKCRAGAVVPPLCEYSTKERKS